MASLKWYYFAGFNKNSIDRNLLLTKVRSKLDAIDA
jgi:hypothetical protein